jgi:hypothetical protein
MTSLSHPIEVSFLPPGNLPFQGRVGITLAPGRNGPGAAGMHERDLGRDMDRLKGEYGTNVLVSLVPDEEAKRHTGVTREAERRAAEARGISYEHTPIEVGELPDIDVLVSLVVGLYGHVTANRTVVVHDRAGGSRAASIIAALLISQGHAATDAITKMRVLRPKVIEPGQAESLHAVAIRLAERATPILKIVELALMQHGWAYQRHPGATAITTSPEFGGMEMQLLLISFEPRDHLAVIARVADTLAPERRPDIADLLHRINWHTMIGAFEMSMDDGEVRYSASLGAASTQLTTDMVDTLLWEVRSAVQRWSPAIWAVATGRIGPADAMTAPSDVLVSLSS